MSTQAAARVSNRCSAGQRRCLSLPASSSLFPQSSTHSASHISSFLSSLPQHFINALALAATNSRWSQLLFYFRLPWLRALQCHRWSIHLIWTRIGSPTIIRPNRRQHFLSLCFCLWISQINHHGHLQVRCRPATMMMQPLTRTPPRVLCPPPNQVWASQMNSKE